MAGMIPTSARPAFRSSAHCDGTANERSYRPVRGPSVKPQTSGAVFRNSTMEMRSLPIFANARGQFTIAQPVRLPNALGKEGQAGSHPTQICGEFKGPRARRLIPKYLSWALITEMCQNPIFPIETMNLTFKLTMANIEGE